MKKYEYSLTITVKDAEPEDILQLVDKLRARVGKVVVQSPGVGELYAQPKEVIAKALKKGREKDLEEFRGRVVEALERVGNNQAAAARLLGVSPETLRQWTKKFGLQSPRQLRRALSPPGG